MKIGKLKEKLLYSYLPLLMCSILLVSTLSLSRGNSVSAEENASAEVKDSLEEQLFSTDGDFVKFLEGIEQLPPGIEKQGPEKISKWLSKKTGVEVTTDGENILVPSLAELEMGTEQTVDDSLITTYGAWECITAVGLMIGTVGFPASKILKLKKAIDFLGGVKATVERIYKYYNKYRSWNYTKSAAWKRAVDEAAGSLPGDTLNAFLDFFNILNVKNNCF